MAGFWRMPTRLVRGVRCESVVPEESENNPNASYRAHRRTKPEFDSSFIRRQIVNAPVPLTGWAGSSGDRPLKAAPTERPWRPRPETDASFGSATALPRALLSRRFQSALRSLTYCRSVLASSDSTTTGVFTCSRKPVELLSESVPRHPDRSLLHLQKSYSSHDFGLYCRPFA